MPGRRRPRGHEGACAAGRPAMHHGRSPGASAAGRAPGASSPRGAKPAGKPALPVRAGSPSTPIWWGYLRTAVMSPRLAAHP
jgi:hypothetical protein